MARILYALSLKQPWAALVVHGLKTIEVRPWRTRRRGLILVHASRVADDRPEGWRALSSSALAAAQLRGGILGTVELTGCVAYRSQTAFAADQPRHLNHPDWFRAPVLYGFLLRQPRRVRFRPVAGWVKFFPVEVSEEEVGA
jgi:hypothetical protein